MTELIGTFALTFIGVGSIIVGTLPGESLSLLSIAIAFGLVVATIVSATGHISGAHINPAVTCSILATNRIPPALAIGYIIAQLVGSTIAAYTLSQVVDPVCWEKVHLGTPALATGISEKAGFIIEFLL